MSAPISKLTPATRKTALAWAAKGRFKTHVAQVCRVDRETLARWLREHADFAEDYAAAEAVGEELLLIDALSGSESAKQSSWFLERLHQTRYGAKAAKHDVKLSGAVKHSHDVDPAALAALVAAVTGDD